MSRPGKGGFRQPGLRQAGATDDTGDAPTRADFDFLSGELTEEDSRITALAESTTNRFDNVYDAANGTATTANAAATAAAAANAAAATAQATATAAAAAIPAFGTAPPDVAAAGAAGVAATVSRSDHTHLGVKSVTPGTNMANGGTATNPILNVTVPTVPGFGTAPPDVAAAGAAGVAATVSRSDHTHLGVKSVTPGTNMANGGTATDPILNVTVPALGTAPPAVAAAGAAGSAATVSRSDHTHQGVKSVTNGTGISNSGTATDPIFNVALPGLVWLQTQEVTGSAVSNLTFSGLDGDVDGEYMLEGVIRANAAGNVTLEPNSITTNMKSIGSFLRFDYGGAGVPGSGMDQTTTAFICLAPSTGTEFTTFNVRFRARRNSWAVARTMRVESEVTRLGITDVSYRGVFWSEQTTNVTSIRINCGATNAFGVGTRISLFKLTT